MIVYAIWLAYTASYIPAASYMTVPELRSDWPVEIPKDLAQVHQTLFLFLEVGSGHETNQTLSLLEGGIWERDYPQPSHFIEINGILWLDS